MFRPKLPVLPAIAACLRHTLWRHPQTTGCFQQREVQPLAKNLEVLPRTRFRVQWPRRRAFASANPIPLSKDKFNETIPLEGGMESIIMEISTAHVAGKIPGDPSFSQLCPRKEVTAGKWRRQRTPPITPLADHDLPAHRRPGDNF